MFRYKVSNKDSLSLILCQWEKKRYVFIWFVQTVFFTLKRLWNMLITLALTLQEPTPVRSLKRRGTFSTPSTAADLWWWSDQASATKKPNPRSQKRKSRWRRAQFNTALEIRQRNIHGYNKNKLFILHFYFWCIQSKDLIFTAMWQPFDGGILHVLKGLPCCKNMYKALLNFY